MSEELIQEPSQELSTEMPTPDADNKPNPLTTSVNKLREVSQAVTKLGEDLHHLVTVLEELTTVMTLFTGLGNKKGGSQQGSALPLALLSGLFSKSGQDSSSNGPDLNQLLFALLSQQMGQNK